MFYDDFEVGDTIGYDEMVNFSRKTGKVIEFVLTEELLKDIKEWETGENIHNIRILRKKLN